MTDKPKECMYSKDNYTNEDRKALCDGCEEECKYAQKEELVSVKNKLKALSDGKQHLGWIDDAMALEMGEELAKEVEDYIDVNGFDGLDSVEEVKSIACHFVNWQKAKDESTTDDLGDYINELSNQFTEVSFAKLSRIAVRVAKWQKEHLWKPADGDDLSEKDREVIALLDNGKVVFAHRPPEYWDGKNIETGKVTRYYPKTYDKGGWNIPDVKYWLDVKLPEETEL